MESDNKKGFFWPSYVDVMTSLFAVVLVLFVVSYSNYKKEEAKLKEYEKNYKEIESVYNAIKQIDQKYFEYNDAYQKFIFKIEVNYPIGEFDINRITDDVSKLEEIKEAGEAIRSTIASLASDTSIIKQMKFLVVIEGQASADGYKADDYRNNDVLSYQRAMKLNEFWKSSKGGNLDFTKMDKCELLVCGSGVGGVPRKIGNESANQRFLIHIVPVFGKLVKGSSEMNVN